MSVMPINIINPILFFFHRNNIKNQKHNVLNFLIQYVYWKSAEKFLNLPLNV